MSQKTIKALLEKTTYEQKKEAYNKAKADTLNKFPSMYKFFDFIEHRLGECREESDLTSELKGVKKVDD